MMTGSITLWNQILLEFSVDPFNTLQKCGHIKDVHEEVDGENLQI